MIINPEFNFLINTMSVHNFLNNDPYFFYIYNWQLFLIGVPTPFEAVDGS